MSAKKVRMIGYVLAISFTTARVILALWIYDLVSAPDYDVQKVIIIFGIAAATDFFDGFVARKTDSGKSAAGKMYDSIADKILIDPNLWLIGWGIGGLYRMLTVTVVAIDVLLVLVRFKYTLEANWFGKFKMWAQSFALGFLLIAPLEPSYLRTSYCLVIIATFLAFGSLWGHWTGRAKVKEGQLKEVFARLRFP